MAVIKNFLYDSLSYTITTGVNPVVVGNRVTHPKIGIPVVTWDINFGVIQPDLANLIQDMLFESINNLFLASHVFPAVKLYKATKGLDTFYTYVYVHEEAFYGPGKYDLINRRLSYTTDGAFDTITEGSLVVDLAKIGSVKLVNDRFIHFVHYMGQALKVKHIGVGLMDTSLQVNEFFHPSDLTGWTVTYIGRSHAYDSGIL